MRFTGTTVLRIENGKIVAVDAGLPTPFVLAAAPPLITNVWVDVAGNLPVVGTLARAKLAGNSGYRTASKFLK